jgi:hypothetical protein
MTWTKAFTSNGWRVFPDVLVDAYLKRISPEGRGMHRVSPVETSDVFLVDLPGMAMVDRSYHVFSVDGLDLKMPCRDVPILEAMLRGATEELLPGGVPAYGLRGWLVGVLMTEVQRGTLLAQMAEALPAMKVLADAEDREFARRIDAVNVGQVRVISARAEATKRKPVEDDKKGN